MRVEVITVLFLTSSATAGTLGTANDPPKPKLWTQCVMDGGMGKCAIMDPKTQQPTDDRQECHHPHLEPITGLRDSGLTLGCEGNPDGEWRDTDRIGSRGLVTQPNGDTVFESTTRKQKAEEDWEAGEDWDRKKGMTQTQRKKPSHR
ncbi:hypothetical protein E6O75_ATG04746 [Venturia nashicola]|uniref:Uncharacterized protein n=1 Tax=Venturia nashicola TaxID=86259 RepID=A0A4Z1P8W3_9PEZI|nr:hypothetical protein E6O75_ATG04746 [Venturia nashicola]